MACNQLEAPMAGEYQPKTTTRVDFWSLGRTVLSWCWHMTHDVSWLRDAL